MASNDEKGKTVAILMLATPTAVIVMLSAASRMRFLQPILLAHTVIALLLSLSWLGFLVWLFQDWFRNNLSQRSVEREKERHPAPQLDYGDSSPMGGPRWTEEERGKQQEMASEEQSRAIGAREAAEPPRYYGSHPPYTVHPKGDFYRLGITPENQSTDDDSSDRTK